MAWSLMLLLEYWLGQVILYYRDTGMNQKNKTPHIFKKVFHIQLLSIYNKNDTSSRYLSQKSNDWLRSKKCLGHITRAFCRVCEFLHRKVSSSVMHATLIV